MNLDLLGIGGLIICSITWLLTVGALVLDRLGRLPRARRSKSRPDRLQLTAGLALMTAVILTQIGVLANWPHPVRGAIDLLTILAGIGSFAAVITAMKLRSAAHRTQLQLDANRPDGWPARLSYGSQSAGTEE